MRISKESFDEFGKKRLAAILAEDPKAKLDIYSGFIDIFGDGVLAECSKCGTPCWVRPWLAEAIKEHGWTVTCVYCADPAVVKGQVAMDFAKIESLLEVKP